MLQGWRWSRQAARFDQAPELVHVLVRNDLVAFAAEEEDWDCAGNFGHLCTLYHAE